MPQEYLPRCLFEDNGDGISESERENIFVNGYSTADDGNGLELSIVADVAKAHGFDMNVTESDTGGTRFEFQI